MTMWLAVTMAACTYCRSLNGTTVSTRDGAASSMGGMVWLLPGSLLFFNNLNILIALCEIALGKHIILIQQDFAKQAKSCRGREMEAALQFLLLPVPWTRLFDGTLWCKMWSTYALYDPSYQNNESFGFFIDVGNGWSTIPPSLLMNYTIVFPFSCSPLVVGCIGIAFYWQMLYGTVIYLLSYCFNRRYDGFGRGEVFAFVGVTNSLWIIFPVAGLYACYCTLRDGDFAVLANFKAE